MKKKELNKLKDMLNDDLEIRFETKNLTLETSDEYILSM